MPASGIRATQGQNQGKTETELYKICFWGIIMNEIIGNLFDFIGGHNVIVIPTNGVTKKDGAAVMGAGIAHTASLRFPALPRLLGKELRDSGVQVYHFQVVDVKTRKREVVVAFPTKFHWRRRSDVSLIEMSAKELRQLADTMPRNVKFYLPRVGCGLGGLNWQDEVAPILDRHFNERFTVVRQWNNA